MRHYIGQFARLRSIYRLCASNAQLGLFIAGILRWHYSFHDGVILQGWRNNNFRRGFLKGMRDVGPTL